MLTFRALSCQAPPPLYPNRLPETAPFPENMQMCESRLQPTPMLALQSSVLQDLSLGGAVHPSPGLSLGRCRSRTPPVTDSCARRDMRANCPTRIVVMAAGEDTCKVKPGSSLQSNVQEE